MPSARSPIASRSTSPCHSSNLPPASSYTWIASSPAVETLAGTDLYLGLCHPCASLFALLSNVCDAIGLLLRRWRKLPDAVEGVPHLSGAHRLGGRRVVGVLD